jgi:hypothetical protein
MVNMDYKHKEFIFVFFIIFSLCLASTISFLFIYRSFTDRGEVISDPWKTVYYDSVSNDDIHRSYVDGTILPPLFRYRILIPYVIDFFNRSTGIRLVYLYSLYFFIALFISLFSMFYLFRGFMRCSTALFGISFFTVMLSWSYTMQQSSDMFSIMIFCVAFYVLSRYPSEILAYLAVSLVILLGTFNKEMTLVIVLAVILYAFRFLKQDWRIVMSLLNLFMFLIPYLLLRLHFGFFTYQFMYLNNIQDIRQMMLFFLFFNISLFFVFRSIFNRDRLSIFKMAIVVYFLINFVTGNIGELRIWLPIMPIFLLVYLSEIGFWFGEQHL